MPEAKMHIAYFITAHGYGHAARAAAVMNAMGEHISTRGERVCFEIFTRAPRWFFEMSLETAFHLHEVQTDVGLAQSTSMTIDLPETVRKLDEMLPYRPELIQELSCQVRELQCKMVLCDIAPMGIVVAQAAGLPSVLIENFTWDWMYEEYLDIAPGIAPHINYLREIFSRADRHIRTEPGCTDQPPADLLTNVVSRKPRTPGGVTRQRLDIPAGTPMVMITMGGILTEYPFLDRLVHADGIRFLIPGGSRHYEQRGSLVLIPHHSDFHHPDLVEASNAVIGKLGYSTLAEAYTAGLPYAYIPRERFRESPPMARFARQVMDAVELSEERFFSGDWLSLLPDLLARPRKRPSGENGADQIADYLMDMLRAYA